MQFTVEKVDELEPQQRLIFNPENDICIECGASIPEGEDAPCGNCFDPPPLSSLYMLGWRLHKPKPRRLRK
ncbi:MAG: hypothetical protein WC461_01930 [Candidatus Paceibacterota bacterium]